MSGLAPWIAVALAGMVLGAAELLSRYRDSPLDLVKVEATYAYLAVNALIGVVTLGLLRTLAPDLVPGEPGSPSRAIYEVLAAGFGGAALFRSAFAKAKVGDAEIGVGPSFVIDVLLAVTDRLVDRERARARTSAIPRLMRAVPPGFAAQELTEYCVALMQNLPAAEERTLNTRVDVIFKTDLSSEIKAMLTGLVLAENIGFRALEDAVRELDPEIEAARKELAEAPSEQALLAMLSAAPDPAPEAAPEAPAPPPAPPTPPAPPGDRGGG